MFFVDFFPYFFPTHLSPAGVCDGVCWEE